ncbi:MAG TPA: aminodeoxychorismate lyase [Thermomonas sp.]|nr:aminodeoxychorismate lyase [Thermomonas sp.]
MASAIYAGHMPVDALSIANRGLTYGDGVFETMRVHRGVLPLWPRHLARLREGAERLGIALPGVDFIEARIADMMSTVDAGVLKLLLTRGEGGRGYAPPEGAVPTWMLSLQPLPTMQGALHVHPCETRLATQPMLAGIKHCNRLEQVLGRAEVERAGCDEGLMRDMAGNPVCATSANLLVLQDGRWRTPPVDACGVAGVLRGWLLAQGLVEASAVTPDALVDAEAVALCNAVRGILPVRALGAREWSPHPATDELQARLAMAYPMFQDAGTTP